MELRVVLETISSFLHERFQGTGDLDVYNAWSFIQGILRDYDNISKEDMKHKIFQLKRLSEAW